MFRVVHIGVMPGSVLRVSRVKVFVLQCDVTHHGTWVTHGCFPFVDFGFLTSFPSFFSATIAMADNDIPMAPASSSPPNTPTLANTRNSAQKQKRSLTPPEPGPSRTKRSRKGGVPAQSKKGKRPSDWHLRKGEIPAKSEATKAHRFVVFNLILCSCPSS